MGFSFCVDTDRTLKEPSLHAQKEKLSQSFVTLAIDNEKKGAGSQAYYGTTSDRLPLLPSGPGGVRRQMLA